MEKLEVTFQTKSKFQKDDCLFCDRLATIEACCSLGNTSANIRCCDNERCKEKAANMAREQTQQLSGLTN